MKYFFLSLFLLLASVCCFAENDSSLIIKAVNLSNKGNYGEAISILDKALQNSINEGNKGNQLLIYLNLGNIYNDIGKSVECLQAYQNALKIAEEIKNQHAEAAILNNIGALYREQNNPEQALKYHNKAEAIAIAVNDSLVMADCANDKGIIAEMQKDFDTAIKHYQSALDIYSKLGNDKKKSITLNNLGVMYKQKGENVKAIDCYKQALAIAEKYDDKFVIAANHVNIGNVYKEMKDYQRSLDYNNKGFELAKQIDVLNIMVSAAENIAQSYEGLGDYTKAYEWQKKFTLYSDSLINIERSKQIAESETKYQTAKKEKQIQEQQFELTKKNYWIYGSIGLLILFSLLGYSFYHRNKLRQETRLKETIIRQQEISTKAVLEAEENERKRIAQELHDGVGQMMSAAKMNLSAFESDIQFKDDKQKTSYEKIVSLVDESCNEVRSVSHQMMPNALLKKGLASATREFIDKIDSRILKVDLYSEGLNETIDSNTETVLYRVIQECVNNVIKHSGATNLDISLIKDHDGISITIEDNGKGFNPAQENIEGIGLKNMRSRVEYLKGTIEFSSTLEKGTLVAIHVPLLHQPSLTSR